MLRDVRPFLQGVAPADINAAFLQEMFADHPRPLQAREDVWALTCNSRGDRKAVAWLYGLSLTWDDPREIAFASFAGRDQIDALKQRSRAVEAGRAQVYVSTECAPVRVTELAELPGLTITYVSLPAQRD